MERKEEKREIIELALEVSQDIFVASFTFYLISLLLEELKQGFVSHYLNLNIILGVVIASGIITLFGSGDKLGEKKRGPLATKDYLWIFAVGLVGVVLVSYKTRDLGSLSYIVSIISGAIIVLLSILLLSEEDDSPENNGL